MSFQRLYSPREMSADGKHFRELLCSIYIDVRAKRNRSIRLFENRSIVFLIIERFEFLMLRFYNVCEDIYLVLLESSRFCLPPVGHPSRTVPSVKETQNIFSAVDSKILEFSLKRFLICFYRSCNAIKVLIIKIMHI